MKISRKNKFDVLNVASITLISVAVVSIPVNAHQSFTTRPAPITSAPRFTVPAYKERDEMSVAAQRSKITSHGSRVASGQGMIESITYHQRYLKQTREFFLTLYTRLWVNESTLVTQRAITSNKNVISHRLSKDFDFQHVRDNLLRLTIYIRMYECDMIVTGYNISQRGQPFFDSL